MKQIAKAIIAVMKEVKGMEKNSRIGKGTKHAYDGTKDQDVKEVMNKAMANNGLCILPISIEPTTKVSRWQEETSYGLKQKQSVFTEVVTKYLLLHESGESIELSGYGHGVDSQDKGAGKATTYALKNCLLYLFLTPVGKIDDTDTTHSESIKAPQKTKKAYPVANYEKGVKAMHKGTSTLDDIKKVYTVSSAAEKVLKEMVLKLADKEFEMGSDKSNEHEHTNN